MLAPIETKGPESRARKPIRPNLTGEMEFSRYRKKLVLASKLEEIEAMRQALVAQKEALERESQLESQYGESHSSQRGGVGGNNSLHKGSLSSSQRMVGSTSSLLLVPEEPKKPLTREEKRLMRQSVAPIMSAKLEAIAKIGLVNEVVGEGVAEGVTTVQPEVLTLVQLTPCLVATLYPSSLTSVLVLSFCHILILPTLTHSKPDSTQPRLDHVI